MYPAQAMITVLVCLFFLGSCAEALILLHPDAGNITPAQSIRHNFKNECAQKFEHNKGPDAASAHYDLCSDLMLCISDKASGTSLDSFRYLSIYEKLKPPGSHIAMPISEMKENAEKHGVKAIDMANLIDNIRQQCLIDTGLDQVYQ